MSIIMSTIGNDIIVTMYVNRRMNGTDNIATLYVKFQYKSTGEFDETPSSGL